MAATHTTNLGLNKPARGDFVSVVSDINDNMDKIDAKFGDFGEESVAEKFTGIDNNIARNAIVNTDLNAYTVDSGSPDLHYYGSSISSMSNKPSGETYSYPFTLDVSNNGGFVIQTLSVYTQSGEPRVYVRQQYYDGNKTFGNWASLAFNNQSSAICQTITGATNNTGHTINSGEYFIANGGKYQATASIPNGQTWSDKSTAVSDNDIINALNSKMKPTTISNCNDMATEGMSFGYTTDSTSNSPGAWYIVFSVMLDSTTGVQIAFASSANYVKLRRKNNSSWTSWTSLHG